MSTADGTPEVPADESETYSAFIDLGLKYDKNARHRRTMEVRKPLSTNHKN